MNLEVLTLSSLILDPAERDIDHDIAPRMLHFTVCRVLTGLRDNAAGAVPGLGDNAVMIS